MKFLKQIYSYILNVLRKIDNVFFGHRKYKKVVIICQARTGSNLLVSLLNSHPKIVLKGEIFESLKGTSTNQIWNKHFVKYSKKVKVVGFKIFYQHPFDGNKNVWKRIKNDSSILVIHLVRKDTLRSFVSLKIAEKTNRWHESVNSKNLPNDKNVFVDLEEYIKYTKELEINIQKTRNQFSDSHEFKELNYEDFVDDKPKYLNEIVECLGVNKIKFKTKMIRQNSEPLQNLIINFDEVKSYMISENNLELFNFSQ